jgi:hypothetical protein
VIREAIATASATEAPIRVTEDDRVVGLVDRAAILGSFTRPGPEPG